MTHTGSQKLNWKQHFRRLKNQLKFESAQQARLPLDQGDELSTHDTQSCRDSGHELRTSQYWPAFTVSPVRHARRCHRQKSTHPIQQHRPNFNARPPLNPRCGRHSTLSGAFSVLPHKMERQRCEHASREILSISIEHSRTAS